MPLTRFGKACQEYRRGIDQVIADQSAAIGYSTALISGIERGIYSLPSDYLEKLTRWFELDRDNAMELALLAILNPSSKRGRGEKPAVSEESLASILDRLEIDLSSAETADENR